MAHEKTFLLPKSKIWAVHKSRTVGKYYYFNLKTGKSFWERPEGVEDDDMNFPEGFVLPEKKHHSLESVRRAEKMKRIKCKRPKNDGERKELSKDNACKTRTNKAKRNRRKRLKEGTSQIESLGADDDLPSASKKQKPSEVCEEMDWSSGEDANVINNNDCASESNTTFEWSSLVDEVTPMEIVDSNDTHVVIDTNILIHDLGAFESLANDNYTRDGGNMLFIIPWQVLNELDGLKKNTLVGEKSRRASRFLQKCFRAKSCNVIAQSSHQSSNSEQLIKIQVDDDYILACCLQLIARQKITVLLTGDINLRNKAYAQNIEAKYEDFFEQLMPKETPSIQSPAGIDKSGIPQEVLRNMLPRRSVNVELGIGNEARKKFAVPLAGTSRVSSYERNISCRITDWNLKSSCNQTSCNLNQSCSLSLEENIILNPEFSKYLNLSLGDRTSKCSVLINTLKVAIGNFVVSALKVGMSNHFKGDWTKRIYIKPPWSLPQLCLCLEKHWMSLTDYFIPADICSAIHSLATFLKRRTAYITSDDLEEALMICFVIIAPLKKLSSTLVQEFSAQLKDLLHECGGNDAGAFPLDYTNQPQSSRCKNLLEKIANETSDFLMSLDEANAESLINGNFNYDSPTIHVLSNMKHAFPKKIRTVTHVLDFLLRLEKHEFENFNATVDKLNMCILGGTEFPDPFFSKRDLVIFATDQSNWNCIVKLLAEYKQLRTLLLEASSQLVSLI